MMEIITKLINELTGIDFWIAAIALIIVLARWWYLSKKKIEKKIAKRQISFAVVMTVIAASVIAIHRLLFSPDYIFPKDVAGILVLRIEGDDEKNSLQRDLVSTLNTDLSKEAPEQKIEVRAHTETVTEARGLKQAHAKARQIGKNSKALLVIWGNRVDEKKFHPRLTVFKETSRSVISGELTQIVQDITELSLPVQIVKQPIYLIHFVVGYTFYDRDEYSAALSHFDVVLNQPAVNGINLNDIRFYAGVCHWHLAQGQKEMELHLRHAIAYYDTVLEYYTEKDFPEQWASTQNNLGNVYQSLPTGDRSANLQKAIVAYEVALRVRTEKDFPVEWARTQNNLGNAYAELSTGNHSANLQKAIAAYEAALRICTEKDFSVDWAATQNNLGLAYADLPTGDRGVNLQKAIAAYEAALRVYTDKYFPVRWATTQNNLGGAYWKLPIGNRNENLQKAIAAYEAALRICTEKDFPVDWAATQNNLGLAYADLPTGDRSANLLKAIAAFEAALRVYNEKDFPVEWTTTQNNLGVAYRSLPTGDRSANLLKAIACFENALTIWTVEAFPEDHQRAANNLKKAKAQLQNFAKK